MIEAIQSIVPELTPKETNIDNIESIPNTGGVYFLRDSSGCLLYVGESYSLRKRIQDHMRKGAIPFHGVAYAEVFGRKRLLYEKMLIEAIHPPHNIQMNDPREFTNKEIIVLFLRGRKAIERRAHREAI